jgi:L-rhamnose mutarotase
LGSEPRGEAFNRPAQLLFSYFEYTGDDFGSDMARMAAHAKTQERWAVMGPMQEPLEARKSGEWWAEMEEVFHLD